MNKVMSPNPDRTSQDPIQHREHADRLSNLGSKKPAEINKEIGLNLFKDMTLGRRFEDKCAEMYYRGKMFGFVHLYNGQEAISTGVIGAMKRKHDWFCSTYRDHVHALSAGVPAKEVMSELFGKETGCSKGRGGSMHLFLKNIIYLEVMHLLVKAFLLPLEQLSAVNTKRRLLRKIVIL